eukprot:scaffold2088_cov399-Prasinococcus_capsulatus_cf.AAC.43
MGGPARPEEGEAILEAGLPQLPGAGWSESRVRIVALPLVQAVPCSLGSSRGRRPGRHAAGYVCGLCPAAHPPHAPRAQARMIGGPPDNSSNSPTNTTDEGVKNNSVRVLEQGNVVIRTLTACPRGSGPQPRTGSRVTVLVREVLGESAARGEWERHDFEVGDGTALEGLDKGIRTVPTGRCSHTALERLCLTVAMTFGAVGDVVQMSLDKHYTLPDVPAAAPDIDLEGLVLEVHLVSCEGGKEGFALSAEEKLAKAAALKERGTQLFSAGRFRRAEESRSGSLLLDPLDSRSKNGLIGVGKCVGVELFNSLQSELGFKGPNLEARAENDRCRTAQCPLLLNTSLCKIRRKAWQEAADDCTEVLDWEPANAKALYRRGQCRIELEDFDQARDDLLHAVEHDPSCELDVSRMLGRLKRFKDKQDRKDQTMMRRAIAEHDIYTELEVADARRSGLIGKPTNNEMPIEVVEDLERELFSIEQQEKEDHEEAERRRKELWINQGIQQGLIKVVNP